MTERHNTEVTAGEVEQGDTIATELVAPDAKVLGKPLHNVSGNRDEPDTQLTVVTQNRELADLHSALLLDPETETFMRASHMDRNQAWTQAEADWTVKEMGKEITVEEVHELSRPEEEQDEGRKEYVQTWVEILFDEIRYTGGDRDLQDELELQGSTLKMRDFDGRKAVATISLE